MSFKIKVHPKRRSATRLIGKAASELQKALIFRKGQTKFTQADLARLLQADRSVVNRHFGGSANLTLNTIGELAWALDHDVDIRLTPKAGRPSSNEAHSPATSYTVNAARTRPRQVLGGAVGKAKLTLQAENG